mgnify:CR=1 FL=1
MRFLSKYLRYCILAVPLFTVTASYGQSISSDTLVFTKEEAVEFALRHNKSLIAARTTIEQAQARHRQSGLRSNPELQVGYTTDKTFNNEGEYRFGIGFEQRFPVTNRLRHLKNLAEIEIQLAEAEVFHHEHLITQRVETAILNIAQSLEELRLRESQIRLNKDFANFVESRVNAGEASSIEVNQVKLELFSVNQEIQQLKNRLNEQLGSLKQLLGVEVDTAIEILYQFAMPYEPITLPLITDSVLENHPEYKLKKLLSQVADERISLSLANRWDDLAVGVFFENQRQVDFPIGRQTNNFFGVSFSIPLPLSNNNYGAYEESLAYRKQVELELEALSLETRITTETLKEKAASLYEQIFEYDTGVTRLVEQNLRDMNVAYESGLINLTDLFRSQEQRLRILLFQLTMLHDFEQTLVDWKAAAHLNIDSKAATHPHANPS